MKLKLDGTLSKIKSFLDLDTQSPGFNQLGHSAFIQNVIHQLENRRKQLDWSIARIEEKTGIASAAIQAFEEGELVFTWDELQQYAAALGLAFQLVEEIPIDDLISKHSTTEIIATLSDGQMAYGDCAKYITKDPVTKAIMECTVEGELLGPLSLSPDVMKSRWKLLKRDSTVSVGNIEGEELQSELEKQLFVNLIYSDLNYKQLTRYLADIKDQIKNPELADMVIHLYNQLQQHLPTDTSTRNTYEIKNDIRDSKERIVEYFFKGIEMRNKSAEN